jgi:predicted O-linked N-acetylglucosamine transferase (SPINDLY family)
MPECVVSSQKAYLETAIQWGNNPQLRAALKQKMLKNTRYSPLFNLEQYIKHLEEAYQWMITQ